MKGNEITETDRKRWDDDGWFPVSCRICGEVMLFGKKEYNPKYLVGWECYECKRKARKMYNV